MLKSREGYGKNWVHFVYKLDNLLRSIRVSDENSSIIKGFHFFKHILTQDFFAFNMHHSKPHSQSTRVSDENSYVTKTFNFSKLISTQDFFAFNMHQSKPHTKI